MRGNSSKYLQGAAYVMLAFIFVFIIGIARNCGRIQYNNEVYGNSGGDTIDIAIIYGPGSLYYYLDSLTGINKEIADEFSSAIERPIKIWPIVEPDDGMSKLEKGSYDILASLPLDNNIKNRFPVSESIFLDKLVLIQLSDSLGTKPITSSLDLNGKTVSVTAGSSAAQRMKNLAKEIGGNITVLEIPETSDELLTLQVANGSIPLAVVNERVAAELSRYYPDLKFDSSVSFTQFQVWLFNPEDSVIFNRFNVWFEDFRSTDKYLQILDSFY